MVLELNLIQSLALAAAFSMLGTFIKTHVRVFQKYFIPTSVIGGLLAAIIVTIGYSSGAFNLTFDKSLNPLLLQMFFTATGFTFSIKSLKESGIIGLKLAILIVAIAFVQNFIAVGVAPLLGVHPLLALTVGSMSMAGGPGNAAAFGPTIEDLGIQGAAVAAIAAATAGLVIGSIIGGPVARRLITKNKLVSSHKVDKNEVIETAVNIENPVDSHKGVMGKTLLESVILILIAMGLGIFVVQFLNKITGFKWPDYVGGLFIAAIITNIQEARGIKTESRILEDVGNTALNIFLTLTVMSTEIWLLLDLALPLVVLLLVQTIFVALVAMFVAYRILGKDYDAAVMSAGVCGSAIGSTPNAVANMDSVIADNGPAPIPMTILPPVVSIALSVLNPIFITLAISMFS